MPRIGIGVGVGARRSASFKPTDISGCVLWLRADLGVTLVSGAVSAWADQSGGSLLASVTQGTSGKRPTFNASDAGFNSQPTFTFASASTQSLRGTFGSSLAQPATIIAVAKQASAAVQFVIDSNADATNRWAIYNSTAGNALNGYTPASGDFASVAISNGITNAFAIAAEFAGASAATYANGTTATGAGNSGSGVLSGIAVGAHQADAGGFDWDGQIAEVIIYSSALSTLSLSRVFAYTNARYGTPNV